MTETAVIARLRADERMNVVLPKLVEVRAAKARLDAEEARLLAEAQAIAADWTEEAEYGSVGSDAGFPYRSVAAEIGAAWRVSDRTAQRQMGDAATLVQDYAGTPELRALLPAVVAHGIHDRLSEMTRTVIDARDTDTDTEDLRTTDQIRADIFGDLLLTAAPTAHDGGPTDLGAIRATVQITVPVMSPIEKRITDPYETAFLVGHSPVDPQTACMLTAGAAGWDRILTHPISGQVLAVDRYRPSEQQRRHLTVRDQHCRFPGCRMPAKRCDIDHTLDHAHGGKTCEHNLAHLCERHHTLKHNTAWTVRQLPGGVLEWTSPTGRTYIDTPVSTIEFAPDPESEIPTPDPFAL